MNSRSNRHRQRKPDSATTTRAASDRAAENRPAHLGDFTLSPRVLLITTVALVVGAVSAVTATALLRLIGLITNLVFYRRAETRLVAPGAAHDHAWLVLLAPIVGGLIIGLLARYGSEKIRGHGMPEAIEAILTDGSRVSPRVAALKPVSAAISIGTGGPFGAEGPIIMTGGAVGSILAQALKLSADERKTLLVAGAAGGMAATFNAPLASILLAVVLLLFEWRPRSFIPVSAAVIVSVICRYLLLGSGAIFPVANIAHPGSLAITLSLVPGLTGGLLAIAATALVYLAEDGFHRLPVHWMWWPAIGGLIIGIGGLFVPQALGVGYNVIDALLTGRAGLSLIIGILIVKTLIWALSLGSGTSGGVLAPVFMIGGALGALEGHLLPHMPPGFWAMAGLAAVVGGVMRSPLTGIVFTLELTHAWNDMLPLVVASVSAYTLSVLLLKRSVLTEKIARRRLHLTREYTTDPLEVFFASEVAARDAIALRPAELSYVVLARLAPGIIYPVVDDDRQLLGVVTRQALLDQPGGVVGTAVIEPLATVYDDDTLRHVANAMALAQVTSTPVLRRSDDSLYGVITLEQLLHARRSDLREELHREKLLPTPRRASQLGAALAESSTQGSNR
ncbi:MAG TPA: chloride channel protein [Mycobacteriales bacterium]|nr:chloride channel protein [Mycobacteriales bacterium]